MDYKPWKAQCQACRKTIEGNWWEVKDVGLSEPCPGGCGEVLTMTVTQRPGDGENSDDTIVWTGTISPNFKLVWDTKLYEGPGLSLIHI